MKKLIFSFLLCPFLLFSQEQQNTEDIVKDEKYNKGFFNLTKVSYTKVTSLEQELSGPGIGSGTVDLETDGTNAFALQTINGYFLNPYLSLGLGISLEGFISPTINTFPVFADVRVYFVDDYSSPFVFGNYGALMRLGEEFKRGNMFAVGAGYKFTVGKERRTALVTDISYSGRKMSMTDDSLKDSDNVLTTGGISIGIGVVF
ncbi:hypothetical protein ACI6PS_07695 [Flavobacterium sp. PLA-1-15]|uniref:hypothetical protein n=1 Tax=Flavobacterium sp. PLA-1-15 TaxID=3380533 RepID=UPI003B7FCEC8